jgi:hypothetical protein
VFFFPIRRQFEISLPFIIQGSKEKNKTTTTTKWKDQQERPTTRVTDEDLNKEKWVLKTGHNTHTHTHIWNKKYKKHKTLLTRMLLYTYIGFLISFSRHLFLSTLSWHFFSFRRVPQRWTDCCRVPLVTDPKISIKVLLLPRSRQSRGTHTSN